jgi:hypothetical protein
MIKLALMIATVVTVAAGCTMMDPTKKTESMEMKKSTPNGPSSSAGPSSAASGADTPLKITPQIGGQDKTNGK